MMNEESLHIYEISDCLCLTSKHEFDYIKNKINTNLYGIVWKVQD